MDELIGAGLNAAVMGTALFRAKDINGAIERIHRMA